MESTIYCAPDARGLGVGTLLYRALLEVLDACGYWNVYALVADPNPASEHIHQRLGFSCVGRTPHTAYKWGWLGLSTWWLGAALRQRKARPHPARIPRRDRRHPEKIRQHITQEPPGFHAGRLLRL